MKTRRRKGRSEIRTVNTPNELAALLSLISWRWNMSKHINCSFQISQSQHIVRWKPNAVQPTSASSARFLRYVAASISHPSSYNHSSCCVARLIASSLCSSVLTISTLASKSRRAARTCFNPPTRQKKREMTHPWELLCHERSFQVHCFLSYMQNKAKHQILKWWFQPRLYVTFRMYDSKSFLA